MVRMDVRSIHINDTADRQFVTLAEKDGSRTLTIVIGWTEVQAIDRIVKAARPQRPLTHELLVTLVEATGAKLERVDITDLKEGTYYALLRLVRPDGSVSEVDARPSDALAMAAGLSAPIYVAEAVLEASKED